MVKRGEPIKQITVSTSVYERFVAFRQYGEPREALLIKLMDMADKYKSMTGHRKKKKEGEPDARVD